MTDWSDTDRRLMARALDVAARGAGLTRPNPAVGAVIVAADGAILGEGFHRRAGEPHAEVEALRDAESRGADVRGATMYVTLEPCNHTGRTGPCSGALLAAGIGRVVVAMRDPNALARGGVGVLRAAGVRVDVGLLEERALLLNPAFNTFHALGRPLVTLKWAMTLDGCTSVESGDSKWITGPAARAEVHRQRAAHDAVLAGVGTVIHDDARLTARDVAPPPVTLRRIVLDTTLRLPLESAFLQPDAASTAIVACADDADEERRRALADRGAAVWRLPRGPGGVSISALMERSRAEGVQSIYVEGGRTVAGAFLEAGCVDRVEAWIAPKLAGGGGRHLGPAILASPLVSMGDAFQLHHAEVESVGGDFVLRGWLTGHLFPSGAVEGGTGTA